MLLAILKKGEELFYMSLTESSCFSGNYINTLIMKLHQHNYAVHFKALQWDFMLYTTLKC